MPISQLKFDKLEEEKSVGVCEKASSRGRDKNITRKYVGVLSRQLANMNILVNPQHTS